MTYSTILSLIWLQFDFLSMVYYISSIGCDLTIFPPAKIGTSLVFLDWWHIPKIYHITTYAPSDMTAYLFQDQNNKSYGNFPWNFPWKSPFLRKAHGGFHPVSPPPQLPPRQEKAMRSRSRCRWRDDFGPAGSWGSDMLMWQWEY